MQSSDQTTEAPTDSADGSKPYSCIVEAKLHAREKNSKRKRPAHGLLGKRTNAILDKHGLRSIIPQITLTETECTDSKYTHYTSTITFEANQPSMELELALNELCAFVVNSVRPRLFGMNTILSYSFDLKQEPGVQPVID